MLNKASPLYFIIALCLVTIYALFAIKKDVVFITVELKEVNNQIQYEKDKTHVLKAEFAYLTNPDRLKQLNAEYIKLSDTKIAQLEVDPLIEEKTLIKQNIAHENSNSQHKWRYKKGPSKYLTMVSSKR
ncbi:MAG: hypothetical protein AB8B66_03990 [Rickettsiaceae bacterium]